MNNKITDLEETLFKVEEKILDSIENYLESKGCYHGMESLCNQINKLVEKSIGSLAILTFLNDEYFLRINIELFKTPDFQFKNKEYSGLWFISDFYIGEYPDTDHCDFSNDMINQTNLNSDIVQSLQSGGTVLVKFPTKYINKKIEKWKGNEDTEFEWEVDDENYDDENYFELN